jgi:hypothetical protein
MLIKQVSKTCDLWAYRVDSNTKKAIEISCNELYSEVVKVKRPSYREEVQQHTYNYRLID